jgi:hypothetical protein
MNEWINKCRKDLFWPMVSVHGCLDPLLLGLWWCRTSWQWKWTWLPTSWWSGSKEWEGRCRGIKCTLQSHIPSDLRTRPYLLKFLLPSKSTINWRISHQPWTFRDIQDPNYNIPPLAPKGSCPSHSVKCIQFISKASCNLNRSSIAQSSSSLSPVRFKTNS